MRTLKSVEVPLEAAVVVVEEKIARDLVVVALGGVGGEQIEFAASWHARVWRRLRAARCLPFEFWRELARKSAALAIPRKSGVLAVCALRLDGALGLRKSERKRVQSRCNRRSFCGLTFAFGERASVCKHSDHKTPIYALIIVTICAIFTRARTRASYSLPICAANPRGTQLRAASCDTRPRALNIFACEISKRNFVYKASRARGHEDGANDASSVRRSVFRYAGCN